MNMNVFGIIILIALLVEFCLELVGNILNLGALQTEQPEELGDIYDASEYRRAQEYLRSTTRLSLISKSSMLLVLLIFWSAGGFSWLNTVVQGLGFDSLITGLLYIGLLFFGTYLIGDRKSVV